MLDYIVTDRKKAIEELKRTTSVAELERQIHKSEFKHVSFKEALQKPDEMHIIAELKKASPSKGIICHTFYPVDTAVSYEKYGASALSVLTEPKYFLGDNRYLTAVKQNTTIPILRKDFIIDPIQIYEAKAIGADAILLIVAILSQGQLRDYYKLAKDLDMDVLVETHNRKELEIALDSDAEIIGINNRNLANFKTTLKTSEELREYIPSDKIAVSESGIHTIEDIQFIKNLGFNAVLIGESMIKLKNPKEKLQEFKSVTANKED